MPADQGTIDSINTNRISETSDVGSWATAQLQVQYVNHNRRLDLISEKLLSDFVNTPSMGPLAAGQEGSKVANTTPPETGLDLSQLAAQLSTVLAFLQAQANGPSPVSKA